MENNMKAEQFNVFSEAEILKHEVVSNWKCLRTVITEILSWCVTRTLEDGELEPSLAWTFWGDNENGCFTARVCQIELVSAPLRTILEQQGLFECKTGGNNRGWSDFAHMLEILIVSKVIIAGSFIMFIQVF
jgi:hypothetical protein